MEKEIGLRDLDEYISTNFENDILIMREISRLQREQEMKKLMVGVAQKLQECGVDFSKADISKL